MPPKVSAFGLIVVSACDGGRALDDPGRRSHSLSPSCRPLAVQGAPVAWTQEAPRISATGGTCRSSAAAAGVRRARTLRRVPLHRRALAFTHRRCPRTLQLRHFLPSTTGSGASSRTARRKPRAPRAPAWMPMAGRRGTARPTADSSRRRTPLPLPTARSMPVRSMRTCLTRVRSSDARRSIRPVRAPTQNRPAGNAA